jgi:pyridoxal phosphate enzyme (YggS family)
LAEAFTTVGGAPGVYEARVRDGLERVRAGISAALERAGRTGRVGIVAVTKGHAPEAAVAAAAAGLRMCGENRVQELESKRAALGDRDAGIEWHLIGHLQRNKVRRALGLFVLFQALDSLRLAESLSREAVLAGRTVSALVQVNASGEATKGGFPLAEGLDAVARIAELPGLRVEGLMTMAPFTDDGRVVRSTFRRTRELFDACARDVRGFHAEHLSMGMSSDYEVAVEEGSTLVRLGTILFGERGP